jgi:hypothetical protein
VESPQRLPCKCKNKTGRIVRTHLIDIYPAIYKGKDRVPLNYETPFLTYTSDFPALALGYRLPAYRLAIEVVE